MSDNYIPPPAWPPPEGSGWRDYPIGRSGTSRTRAGNLRQAVPPPIPGNQSRNSLMDQQQAADNGDEPYQPRRVRFADERAPDQYRTNTPTQGGQNRTSSGGNTGNQQQASSQGQANTPNYGGQRRPRRRERRRRRDTNTSTQDDGIGSPYGINTVYRQQAPNQRQTNTPNHGGQNRGVLGPRNAGGIIKRVAPPPLPRVPAPHFHVHCVAPPPVPHVPAPYLHVHRTSGNIPSSGVVRTHVSAEDTSQQNVMFSGVMTARKNLNQGFNQLTEQSSSSKAQDEKTLSDVGNTRILNEDPQNVAAVTSNIKSVAPDQRTSTAQAQPQSAAIPTISQKQGEQAEQKRQNVAQLNTDRPDEEDLIARTQRITTKNFENLRRDLESGCETMTQTFTVQAALLQEQKAQNDARAQELDAKISQLAAEMEAKERKHKAERESDQLRMQQHNAALVKVQQDQNALLEHLAAMVSATQQRMSTLNMKPCPD